MSESETKELDATAEEGKRLLQDLHDQGLIDLDAPMRQLFDRMVTPGDVSGFQLASTKYGGPSPDQWWVYIDLDEDDDGGRTSRVFAGSDLKDTGLRQ